MPTDVDRFREIIEDVLEHAGDNRKLTDLADISAEQLELVLSLTRWLARAPEEPLIGDGQLLDATEIRVTRALLIGLAVGRHTPT